MFKALYSGYGDAPPQGHGPNQDKIVNEGNAYLQAQFPLLDHITTAVIQ